VGLIDDLKEIASKFKLLEIKNQLTEGTVNIFLGGKHYHITPPPEVDLQRIASTDVTPELQNQFQETLRRSIDFSGNVVASLPEEEQSKTIAAITVASAAKVLDPIITIVEGVGVEEFVAVEIKDPNTDSP
jgi:hypothetical protein